MATVDDLIKKWTKSKASLRCDEVTAGLESLGFVVKEGKCPGHKRFSHQHLPDFFGASYNCGHGKNPEILSGYIVKIIKILNQYQDDLEKFAHSLN